MIFVATRGAEAKVGIGYKVSSSGASERDGGQREGVVGVEIIMSKP
jgi:hypothetical protein